MAAIRTVAARKAAKLDRMKVAFTQLEADLEAYAKAHGGRFVVYGSFAREQARITSDVDILVGFPASKVADACGFAERRCYELGLEPDIRPMSWCTEEFVQAALQEGRSYA